MNQLHKIKITMMGLSTYYSMIMIMCLLALFSPFQLTFSVSSMQPLCHSEERSALMQFKESFIISKFASEDPEAYPKVVSWKVEGNDTDCCSWDGVKCDTETGHVISLDLYASCLFGSINSNSSLFRLVHLQVLDLSHNDFNGSHIPTAIGNLSKLTYLDLSNSFVGQIPSEISMLSKLSFLALTADFDPATLHVPRLLELKTLDVKHLIQNLTSLEHLALGSIDISSPVPDILANFSSLRFLRLVNCGFYGGFPVDVFRLPSLSYLKVGYDPALTGYIPASVGNLHSLEILGVPNCNFTGVIPFSIGNLTKLTNLGLGSNSFTGQIPFSMANLTQLTFLNLYSNNLSGTINLDAFLTLKKLTALDLSFNNFLLLNQNITNSTLPMLTNIRLASCGLNNFPHFLRGHEKLTVLDLSSNNLHGTVPSWLWTIGNKTLEFLTLSYNFLTGFDQVPFVLPWSRLRFLDLNSNMLQGSLPIPPFSTLYYSISNNSLAGEIPTLICKVRSLQVLDLSENNLNGVIPLCLGNFSSSLSILNVQGNNLHGTIPHTWTNGTGLKMINLGQNKLQGQVPTSLASCKMLQILDLCNNQLNDTFPSWLETLPALKILILRHNKFQGKIVTPESISAFPKLQILDISSNNFIGSLPGEYFRSWYAMQVVDEKIFTYMGDVANMELTDDINEIFFISYYYSITITNKGVSRKYEKIIEVFTAIDLSCNKFSGEIPAIIGNLKGLELLNLSNNLIVGNIPSSIGNLTKLEALDLSKNKLSGEIPQQLGQLTFLEVFNVSYNHLAGPIPQGSQFGSFQNDSFHGNLGLCGEPLSKKCKNLKALPAPPPSNAPSSELFEFDWKIVVLGYGSGLVFGVVVGHIVTTRKQDWFVKTFSIRHRRSGYGRFGALLWLLWNKFAHQKKNEG